MAVGDRYEVKIFCFHAEQGSVNVCHYVVANDVGSLATPQQIADEFSTLIGAAYRPCMAATALYYGLSMQFIGPGAPLTPVNSIAGQGNGTGAGELLPRQVAGIFSKRTTFAGRRNRGRFYAAFPSEGLNDTDASPTAAYLTNLTTLAGVVFDPPDLDPGAGPFLMDLAIRHADDGSMTLVQSVAVKDRWATQRRRGSFGRPNTAPF